MPDSVAAVLYSADGRAEWLCAEFGPNKTVNRNILISTHLHPARKLSVSRAAAAQVSPVLRSVPGHVGTASLVSFYILYLAATGIPVASVVQCSHFCPLWHFYIVQSRYIVED